MKVEVVEGRCRQVAEQLRVLGLPAPVEPFASSTPEFDQATANLILVAICHQTQRLQGVIDGRLIRGWDYLQTRFLAAVQNDAIDLTPDSLANFSGAALASVLACDDLLSKEDLDRRAELIRDCGSVMRSNGYLDATAIYERCGHRLSVASPHLLGELAKFSAYRDPVRKKSLYLLGLNQSTCGWTYQDADSLYPPVDYHEVRGHLRLGTILIRDQDLMSRISSGKAVTEDDDVSIRSAVTEAILCVANIAEMTPMQLHYGFWNLFRNVCVRQRPMCCDAKVDSLPVDYQHLIIDGCCPFTDACRSSGQELAIDEHFFQTDWY